MWVASEIPIRGAIGDPDHLDFRGLPKGALGEGICQARVAPENLPLESDAAQKTRAGPEKAAARSAILSF